MRIRFMVVVCLLAGFVALAGCASSASSPSSAASGSQEQSSAAADLSPAAPEAGNIVTISFEYSAGTGYEWSYAMDPEGVMEETGEVTEGLSDEKDRAGGPLRTSYSFKAVAPGEVVLTFDFAREWEDAPIETQTYAFTVTDDMQMVLNPYKSDFENEPEWSNDGE